MKEEHFFYVPNAHKAEQLPEEEAKHAIRVLRLNSDDKIYLQDGQGTFYHAEVTMTDKKHCFYNILEAMPQEKSWKGHIHLAIAPTKMMERMEWMVEKATEVGFDEISFLNCKFSERKTIRKDRIERIVVSAFKQSRKPWMPIVNEMTSFDDFISQKRRGLKYICHCYNEIPKSDFFNDITNITDAEDITVLVGPEGDFSIDEVRLALQQGYKSVTLGASRLRTETAGLAAVMMSQLARRKD